MSEVWPFDVDPPDRPGRFDADPESVEKGLVQLVLTLVELLRQLMERQAVRRVDAGVSPTRRWRGWGGP